MAATITKLTKPLHPRALDTSGNNNHGTAYTGQALEFDGVGDYITMPLTFMNGATAVSISLWFNTTESNSGMIAKYASSSIYAWWINVEGGKLTANINANRSATSDLTSTIDVNDGNWHYATLTWSYSSGLASLYLDGVLIDTDANTNETDLRNGSLNNTIGFQGYISGGTLYEQGAGLHQGLLSNVQIWDTVLTASDVAYAYLNPEKLALDNSGTSLTYSNLKLWYPMNDSTRGTQINVMDGANTGLGDEIITSDMSWNLTSTGANWSQNGTAFTSDGSATGRIYTAGAGSIVVGNTYKISYDITSYTSGAVRVELGTSGDAGAESNSGIGSYSTYFTAKTNTNIYINQGGLAFVGTFDNLSILPVNAKNHGTSSFYGDELAVNGDMETFPTLHATNDDTFTDETVDGNQNITFTQDATGNHRNGSKSGRITLNDASGYITYNKTDYIVGRTYRASIWFKKPASKVITALQLFADDSIRGEDGTDGAAITPSNIYQEAYVEFVATATTMMINIKATGSSGDFGFADDFSIKEVGIATGWTEADAQTTIPQLGFQSFNQLGWLDGVSGYVSISDDAAITPTTDGFTVSAWVFAMPNSNASMPIVLKGTDEGDMEYVLYTHTNAKPIFRIGKDGVDGNYDGRISTGSALTSGKWHHVVGTWDGTENNNGGIYIYVNGVLQATNGNSNGTQALVDGSDPLLIGKGVIGSDTVFAEGVITEVSLWNTQLTLTQVQELYNDGEALDATLHSSAANLSGYWRNRGTGTWTDLSTNSNNGTPANVSEYLILPEGNNSRDTQGFLMNRTSTSGVQHTGAIAGSYTRFGHGTNLLSTPVSNASVECWFRSFGGTGASESYATFFGSRASSNILLCRNALAGTVSGMYYLTSGGNQNNLDSTTNCFDDEWHHIAFTFDSGVGKLYIDGSLEDTQDDTGDTIRMGSDTYYMETGADSVQGSRSFSGDVDDIGVYSTTLTATQVARNYKAGKARHRN